MARTAKMCVKCKLKKALKEFPKLHGKSLHICLNCKNKLWRRWYSKNRGKRVQYERIFREKYKNSINKKRRLARRTAPERFLLADCKARALKKKLFFNLTVEDLQIPKICPVLGIPIRVSNKHASDSSPSIDRIDNTKGYIKDNVLVVSWRANNLKRDSSQLERKKLYLFYKNYDIKRKNKNNN